MFTTTITPPYPTPASNTSKESKDLGSSSKLLKATSKGAFCSGY